MHPPSSCPLALPLFPHHFSSQASLVSSKFFPPHPSCSYLFDCVAIVSSCSLALLVLAYCVRRMPAPGKHNSKAGQLRADVITPVLMVYIFALLSVSLGPLSRNIWSGIFPANIKAKCCAITTCVQWLFQIVIAGIMPHLLASVGWAT